MDGMVEQWNDGEQEVRFLLKSSSFPLFQFSIDSNRINWLIYRLIHCFLRRTHVN